MKLGIILEKIAKDPKYKKRLVAAKKGLDFENNLFLEITDDGEYISYPNATFKKHKNFQEIKKLINSGNENTSFIRINLLDDILSTPKVIFQPFGKQSSPDFLFLRKGKALALECKFTEHNIKAPVWNSGLPKLHFNYIFGSLMLEDITFFSGNGLLDQQESNSIIKLVAVKREELKEEGLKITNKFEIYLRPMYNQKENSWKSTNRNNYEGKVIKAVKEFEK